MPGDCRSGWSAIQAVCAEVISTAGRASTSIWARRRGGLAGSRGTYAAPERSTPTTVLTSDADRSRAIATSVSGPAPCAHRNEARRADRSSSSP